MRKTNPICHPPRWDQRDRSHGTKPIAPLEGVGRERPTHEEPRAYRAKQTQFGKPNVQNEPNSRRGRVGRGHRDAGRGAIVRNEANFSIADCGLPTADRARTCGGTPAAQSQTCETNPICCGAQESQVSCDTGFRSDPAPRGPCQTKPILEKCQVSGEQIQTPDETGIPLVTGDDDGTIPTVGGTHAGEHGSLSGPLRGWSIERHS